ncbi:MAG: DNA mismatch repair endonuclease MutL [Deltaproteobacteria bacterium]|nr:DNA mismatch repair endonuclease MutL [Deltaproteobacteria bacterium]
MALNEGMHPIRKLPEELITKIAAGEVVERPLSVVKELVENSIDAGATSIIITLKEGGKQLIAVSDNGRGIAGDQIELALTRHATSKIQHLDDLTHLHSLGFRGEALPSIAAMSKFRLESATPEHQPLGQFWDNTQTLQTGPITRQAGTTVQVQDLFYATPARLKFLKSTATEWGHIHDFILSMALYHLNIEWSLIHQGKTLLKTQTTTNLLDRVGDLFGRETQAQLYSFEREVPGIQMRGFLSHPNFSRSQSKNFFVFVNGRYVQDRVINHAILAGYRSLLMRDQYPMVILDLNIDPQQVDVNVHPSKREVRFANSRAIHSLISETLYRRLSESPWAQKLHHSAERGGGTPIHGLMPLAATFMESEGGGPRLSMPADSHEGPAAQARPMNRGAASSLSPNSEELFGQIKTGTLQYTQLKIIGQLLQTYILCQADERLVLIDQHAAHERIGFEKLKQQFEAGVIPSQRLLHPINVDLRPSEGEILKQYIDELEQFGFEIRFFGGNTFMIQAVPNLLSKEDPKKILFSLLDSLENENRLAPLIEKVDHTLATMACHHQIRAGDPLNLPEMEQLLKDLNGTPHSYHCPHGRPVMVEISQYEIERWFKRVL